MKPFEFGYLAAEPFLPPLYSIVRHRLLKVVQSFDGRPALLDVGGRRSHYTIGIPADVTVTDLPRETEIQEEMDLGMTEEIVRVANRRRSNLRKFIFDDMTRSRLACEAYDCVVAVEVLEHVEEDELFVRQVNRVLKPGGFLLMTTPNGDYRANMNPDHKRHYRRTELLSLLERNFTGVEVDYAVRGGTMHALGLRTWSARRPLETAVTMLANLANTVQSADPSLRTRAVGTHHLVALARKQA